MGAYEGVEDEVVGLRARQQGDVGPEAGHGLVAVDPRQGLHQVDDGVLLVHCHHQGLVGSDVQPVRLHQAVQHPSNSQNRSRTVHCHYQGLSQSDEQPFRLCHSLQGTPQTACNRSSTIHNCVPSSVQRLSALFYAAPAVCMSPRSPRAVVHSSKGYSVRAGMRAELGGGSHQHVRPGINRLIRVSADLHNAGICAPGHDSSVGVWAAHAAHKHSPAGGGIHTLVRGCSRGNTTPKVECPRAKIQLTPVLRCF